MLPQIQKIVDDVLNELRSINEKLDKLVKLSQGDSK